jgi:pimeloyl-ACP methyl ester carboxylesterase
MPFATDNGVRIHWQERGTGTPVLLIMGHRFSGDMWWPVLSPLSAQHRVVWFDNRGTGQSESPPTASVAEMTADALSVMDAAGLDAAHVFGVSMGGGIAQQLALTSPHRVTSLILGCTAIKTEVTKPRPRVEAAMLRLPIGLYRLLGGAALYGDKTPKDVVTKDLAMLKRDKISPSGVVAQSVGIAEFSSTLEEVARISVPTLVQHGTGDKVVPFAAGQQIAETIPGARLSAFTDAGHNYLLMDIDRTNREILEFFAEADAATIQE